MTVIQRTFNEFSGTLATSSRAIYTALFSDALDDTHQVPAGFAKKFLKNGGTYRQLLWEFMRRVVGLLFAFTDGILIEACATLPECSFLKNQANYRIELNTIASKLKTHYPDVHEFRMLLQDRVGGGMLSVFGVQMDYPQWIWLEQALWKYRSQLMVKIPIDPKGGIHKRLRAPFHPVECMSSIDGFDGNAPNLLSTFQQFHEQGRNNPWVQSKGPLSAMFYKSPTVNEFQYAHNKIFKAVSDMLESRQKVARRHELGSSAFKRLPPTKDHTLIEALLDVSCKPVRIPLDSIENPPVISRNHALLKDIFSDQTDEELASIAAALYDNPSYFSMCLIDRTHQHARDLVELLDAFKRTRSEKTGGSRMHMRDDKYGVIKIPVDHHVKCMERATNNDRDAMQPMLYNTWEDTMDANAMVRTRVNARKEEKDHILGPIEESEFSRIRTSVIPLQLRTSVLIGLEAILQIDPFIMHGMQGRLSREWLGLVRERGVVPNDIRDWNLPRVTPHIFTKNLLAVDLQTNAPIPVLVRNTHNRPFFPHIEPVGRHHGQIQQGLLEYTENPRVERIGRYVAEFALSPMISRRAGDWYSLMPHRVPKAFGSPLDTCERTHPDHRLYYEIYHEYWRDPVRAARIFANPVTTDTSNQMFQLPFGDGYVAHAHPIHLLSVLYQRFGALIADHPVTAFAIVQIFLRLNYNIRLGPSPINALSVRLWQEIPELPGIVSPNHAYYMTDVDVFDVAFIFAFKIRGLRSVLDGGGFFEVDRCATKTFAQRAGDAPTLGKTALHEELYYMQAPMDIPRPVPLTILLRVTNSSEKLVKTSEWPECMEVSAMKGDVCRNYDQRMAHEMDDVTKFNQYGVSATKVEIELCMAKAVTRIYDLISSLMKQSELYYMLSRPIISSLESQELLVTFPFVFTESISILKHILASFPIAPCVCARVVGPRDVKAAPLGPGKLDEFSEVSIYPRHVAESNFLFVADSLHMGQPPAVPVDLFMETRTKQTDEARVLLGHNKVAFDVQLFTKKSTKDIPDILHDDPNLCAILINFPCEATSKVTDAMNDSMTELRRADIEEFLELMVTSRPIFDINNIQLDPCSPYQEQNMSCGCPKNMLYQNVRCKKFAFELLGLIKPEIVTRNTYELICAAFLSVRFEDWEMAAACNIMRAGLRQDVSDECRPWSPEFRSYLKSNPMFRNITTRTLAYVARISGKQAYQDHVQGIVKQVLQAELDLGLDMDRVIVDAISFLAMIDYMGIKEERYMLMTFVGNRFQAKTSYEDSLMRRVVSPCIVPFLMEKYTNARDELQDALAEAAESEDGGDKAKVSKAKSAVDSCTRALNCIRRFRSEQDIETNVARMLEMHNFHAVRDGNPNIICCDNALLLTDHDKGIQEVQRDPDALHGIPLAEVERIQLQLPFPEFFITQSTNINYPSSMGTDHRDFKATLKILDQTFNPAVEGAAPATIHLRLRNYFIRDSSRLHHGKNSEKKMRMLLGEAGENGKTTIVKFMECVYGDYTTTCKTTIFTTSEQNSSNASPELAKLSFIRLAFAAELDENDEYSGGQLKKLTSNDPYEARMLFQAPIVVQPVTRFYTHANNKPILRTGGVAAIRRFLIIPFRSRFIENAPFSEADQQRLRQYPIIPTLSEQLPRLAPAFLRLHVLCYPGSTFGTCKEVEDEKTVYSREVDHYACYQSEHLCQIAEDDLVHKSCTVQDAYARFEEFMRGRLMRKQTMPQVAEFKRGLMGVGVGIIGKKINNYYLRDPDNADPPPPNQGQANIPTALDTTPPAQAPTQPLAAARANPQGGVAAGAATGPTIPMAPTF
jgi:hypothetical protein